MQTLSVFIISILDDFQQNRPYFIVLDNALACKACLICSKPCDHITPTYQSLEYYPPLYQIAYFTSCNKDVRQFKAESKCAYCTMFFHKIMNNLKLAQIPCYVVHKCDTFFMKYSLEFLANGPFNLQPLFQKGVDKSKNLVREIWFQINGSSNLFYFGSRKVVDQKKWWVYTINPHFFRLEKSGSANSDFFSGLRKVVDQKNRLVYTTNPPYFRLEVTRTLCQHFGRSVKTCLLAPS